MSNPNRLNEIHGLITGETTRAALAGTAPSFTALQPLYAEKNALGVVLSQKVGRLLPVEYLCADIQAGRLTLSNIGPAVWGDPLENVLRDVTFPDVVTGGRIHIRSLMDSYYGNCWTRDEETQIAWDTFGDSPTNVRIESTVGQLLAALMHPSDRFFPLHFYAGLVEYRSVAALAGWVNTVVLDDLLDTAGLNISMALSVVRNDFVGENEVRIIYGHDAEDAWVRANVTLATHPNNPQGLAQVPCVWDRVLSAITVRSDIPTSAVGMLRQTLNGAGLIVPVTTSKIV